MNPGLALALFALPLATAPDELLPATPDGWRYERLDFPLSFAPDLGLAGFEELRFAPGMFDAESESYWSYALAVRLDGAPEVDAEFLQTFLEGYYRGLCEAVGEDRGLELDYSGFAVALETDVAGFRATIDLIDTFVTAEPIRVEVLLRVHPRHDATEILGLASPSPQDAAVWDELRGIEERWREARPPALLLNHLYVIPDAETYAALAASTFLREAFAVSEERTTVRPDMTYSGLYFYGEDTYFEFLPPDGPLPEGRTGVAFGIESPGGTARLEEALAEVGVKGSSFPVSRNLDGEDLPWFDMFAAMPDHAAWLSLFTLEYDPAFLARWHGELPPKSDAISRRSVLERYAAQLEIDREAPLFRDIEEVELALGPYDLADLHKVLTAAEYRIEESEGGWTANGPGVRFVVRETEARSRIAAFRMSLRRRAERQTIELGRARLSIEGLSATLAFGE